MVGFNCLKAALVNPVARLNLIRKPKVHIKRIVRKKFSKIKERNKRGAKIMITLKFSFSTIPFVKRSN